MLFKQNQCAILYMGSAVKQSTGKEKHLPLEKETRTILSGNKSHSFRKHPTEQDCSDNQSLQRSQHLRWNSKISAGWKPTAVEFSWREQQKHWESAVLKSNSYTTGELEHVFNWAIQADSKHCTHKKCISSEHKEPSLDRAWPKHSTFPHVPQGVVQEPSPQSPSNNTLFGTVQFAFSLSFQFATIWLPE